MYRPFSIWIWPDNTSRYKKGNIYIVIVHVGCFMKISRIVVKRTNKRDVLGFLLFVFLLPYVCACLWGHVGEETKEVLTDREQRGAAEASTPYRVEVVMEWGTWELSVEEFLVYRLAEIMQKDYEKETMKAQAILLRTEVVQSCKAQNDERIQVEDAGLVKFYYADNSEELERYQEAVEETEGLYLCYQGQPIQVSYFKISNGQTRDAKEVWNTDKCPYLTSVACEQDRASAEWSSTAVADRDHYIQLIKSVVEEAYSEETLWSGGQFIYDEAGYVTKVLYVEGEKKTEIDGETFRHLFGLNSASFEMDRDEKQVIFHVTGVGHGFGMSQYGANFKAINGETYDQILKDFFPGTELAKFE